VTPVPEFLLRRLYGLTPAEAALAMEIAHGHGLKSAAELVGIERTTANTQLQRVFEKTQTHRQAELVRLISRMEASLAFDRARNGKT
jgi:DNA-binding CsgD family transcriptional regulator